LSELLRGGPQAWGCRAQPGSPECAHPEPDSASHGDSDSALFEEAKLSAREQLEGGACAESHGEGESAELGKALVQAGILQEAFVSR